MKLTFEANNEIVSIETKHDDVCMEDLYQLFQQLALGAGFHPQNVTNYFEGDDRIH